MTRTRARLALLARVKPFTGPLPHLVEGVMSEVEAHEAEKKPACLRDCVRLSALVDGHIYCAECGVDGGLGDIVEIKDPEWEKKGKDVIVDWVEKRGWTFSNGPLCADCTEKERNDGAG